MIKFIKIAVWFISFIVSYSIVANMLSAADTIENIAGFFIGIAIAGITVQTKCFTTIKFKKK